MRYLVCLSIFWRHGATPAIILGRSWRLEILSGTYMLRTYSDVTSTHPCPITKNLVVNFAGKGQNSIAMVRNSEDSTMHEELRSESSTHSQDQVISTVGPAPSSPTGIHRTPSSVEQLDALEDGIYPISFQGSYKHQRTVLRRETGVANLNGRCMHGNTTGPTETTENGFNH